MIDPAHARRRFQLAEEVGHEAAACRVPHVGRDLGQRDKDEGALVETGVRQRQVGGRQDQAVVEEEIEVKPARSVGEGADAAEVGLNPQ